jgi:hypothetical protein
VNGGSYGFMGGSIEAGVNGASVLEGSTELAAGEGAGVLQVAGGLGVCGGNGGAKCGLYVFMRDISEADVGVVAWLVPTDGGRSGLS